MIDARHFSTRMTLRGGREIEIRSLRPDDTDRMAEAFAKLEQESIHSRFFAAKAGLSDSDLKLIRAIDFETRVALVATLMENGREIIVGSASYCRTGANSAEIAFTVEEDYQGQGIARSLLAHLAEIAWQQGIVRFEADVLPHNTRMFGVLARSGWAMTRTTQDGVVHVILSLEDRQAGVIGSR